MELDVRLGNESLSIPIENPYRFDLDAVVRRIEAFILSKGVTAYGLDIGGLIPLMVRGIAGCEAGCPANAKELVSRGYGKFDLAYVEGGILTAQTKSGDGEVISLKMFPDF